MEPVTVFFTKSDFAGVASTRVHRPAKQVEATLNRLFGEKVRVDGASVSTSGVRWPASSGATGEARRYVTRIAARVPIAIESRVIAGREKDIEHRRDAQALRRFLVQNPAVSRLTLDALPRFSERTGLSLADDFPKVQRFFATETANLILARVLLIRFLEDHGFFDE